MMKRYMQYALGLCLVLAASACRHQEPHVYDSNGNGAYFNYGNGGASRQINFADHIVGSPSEIPVKVKVKRLGYLLDKDAVLVVKSRAVEGKPEAEVTIPEARFAPNQHEIDLEIMVKRPEQRDETYVVELYFDTEDPASTLGAGVRERAVFTIEVKESYTKPPRWDAGLKLYLGEWTPDKHIFLANLFNDSRYAETRSWDKFFEYNKAAVAEIRQRKQQDPSYEALPFPFSNEIEYEKPYYWSAHHDKYLGAYQATTFRLLHTILGTNTSNEVQQLTGDEAKIKGLNKAAMFQLMKNYNKYFEFGYSGSYSKSLGWVPFFSDIDYRVVAPDVWRNDPIGRAMIETYYGKYSDEKYKFMLKTWAAANPGDKFSILDMFPVYIGQEKDTNERKTIWDDTLGGEEQIRRCHKLFYDEWNKDRSAYNFDFPEYP